MAQAIGICFNRKRRNFPRSAFKIFLHCGTKDYEIHKNKVFAILLRERWADFVGLMLWWKSGDGDYVFLHLFSR